MLNDDFSRGLIPKNSLDLALSSTYDHAVEYFPDPIDTIIQPETIGLTTWRRLRNTKDLLPGEDPRIAGLKRELEGECNVLISSIDVDSKSKKKYEVKYFKVTEECFFSLDVNVYSYSSSHCRVIQLLLVVLKNAYIQVMLN